MADTKIVVLWIDDDEKEGSYISRLQRNGIHAHQEFCYEDGIAWLSNKENYDNCDAVILDVKCKIKRTDMDDTDESFINHAYQVYSLCETGNKFMPWFVFTAGTGYKPELLETIPRKPWTLKNPEKYYSKSSDRGTLIEDIKKLTKDAENISIRSKFPGLFDICDEDAGKRLLNLLKVVDKEQNFANTSIFNDIRKILAYLVKYGKSHGLFTEDIDGSKAARGMLREIAKIDPDIVPVYIQTLFFSLEEIVNNGSHSADENDELNTLSVDKDVFKGDAPYLSRTALFQLLTIMKWFCTLPTEEDAIKELADRIALVMNAPINAYKGKTVQLQRDEKGYWHFAQCMLLPRAGVSLDENMSVRLNEVEENTHPKSKSFYPYFATNYTVLS